MAPPKKKRPAPAKRKLAGNSQGSASSSKRGRGPGRPFPPGQSGNPTGRPALPAEYKAAMAILEPQALEALATVLADSKHRRFEQAAEYIINRLRGAPSARVEVTGKDGGPLEVEADDPVTTMLRRMIAQREQSADGGGGSTD